jgi:hypothetical protein
MIGLAVSILWLCIGVIILGAVIYIALRVIRRFFPGMDPNIDYAVWAIFGILILIYVLTALMGGGAGGFHAPIFR